MHDHDELKLLNVRFEVSFMPGLKSTFFFTGRLPPFHPMQLAHLNADFVFI
jgi:hypothetical protein